MNDRILRDIHKERDRQDRKWGELNHNPFIWLAILGEEYGESCQAALEFPVDYSDYRKELIQVAAVTIAAIESLDRQEDKNESS